MRSINILALVTATVSAYNFLDTKVVQALSVIPGSDIEYSASLPCGGCIRSGNTFCQDENVGSLLRISTCCAASNSSCVTEAIQKGMICSAINSTDNRREIFNYAEQFTAILLFCEFAPTSIQREDTGCGCEPYVTPNGTFSANTCWLEKNLTESAKTVSINQDAMPYAASCSYLLKTDCGYPDLAINGNDIEVLVGYNRSWFAKHDSEEITSNFTTTTLVKVQGNHWLLNQNEKTDYPYNQQDQHSGCTNTTVFVVATNLHKKQSLEEARQLKATATQTTMVYFSSPHGEGYNIGLKLAFKLASAVIMIISIAF